MTDLAQANSDNVTVPAGKPDSTAKFTPWKSIMDEWNGAFQRDERPVIYSTGFDFEIGPGLLMLMGGGPGSGKTTLVLQMVTSAMLMDDDIRCVYASVEVPGRELVERQLAIEADVDYHRLRYREDLLQRDRDKIEAKREIVSDALGGRLCVLDRPHDMRNVKAVVDAIGANLVVLDYLQRIPPAVDCNLEQRHAINATMDLARELCDAGCGVIAVSSLSRPAKKTTGYQEASITSFRESGELEYGCDEAWILTRNGPAVTLRHEKGRYRRTNDLELEQDDTLRFSPRVVEWSPT